jgi:hypothetical protein
MTGACGPMPIHSSVGFRGAGQSEPVSKDKSAVAQQPNQGPRPAHFLDDKAFEN